jgi:hypothetical protein
LLEPRGIGAANPEGNHRRAIAEDRERCRAGESLYVLRRQRQDKSVLTGFSKNGFEVTDKIVCLSAVEYVRNAVRFRDVLARKCGQLFFEHDQ